MKKGELDPNLAERMAEDGRRPLNLIQVMLAEERNIDHNVPLVQGWNRKNPVVS